MLQFSNSSRVMEPKTISKNGDSSKGLINRRNFVIFVCLFFISTFSSYAQETRLRIAVIDFECNCYNREHLLFKAREIIINLTTELVNTNKYRVLERSRLEEILKEQGLQSTQISSTQAIEIGRLLGVQKIITGEFSGEYSFRFKTSARLIDVETGDIEAAVLFDNLESTPDTTKKGQRKGLTRSYELSNRMIAQKIILELLK